MLAAGLLLVCGGCGSKNTPGILDRVTSKPHAAPVRKATPADSISPYMVAAVPATKTSAATVEVKFELAGRPDVGQPLDVNVVILPVAVGLDEIAGKLQGEDGLQILSGDVIPPTEKPIVGTPINHTLKVRASRDGIFTLSAVISAAYGGQAVTQTFAFPIIAGAGLANAGTPARIATAPGAAPAATR